VSHSTILIQLCIHLLCRPRQRQLYDGDDTSYKWFSNTSRSGHAVCHVSIRARDHIHATCYSSASHGFNARHPTVRPASGKPSSCLSLRTSELVKTPYHNLNELPWHAGACAEWGWQGLISHKGTSHSRRATTVSDRCNYYLSGTGSQISLNAIDHLVLVMSYHQCDNTIPLQTSGPFHCPLFIITCTVLKLL